MRQEPSASSLEGEKAHGVERDAPPQNSGSDGRSSPVSNQDAIEQATDCDVERGDLEDDAGEKSEGPAQTGPPEPEAGRTRVETIVVMLALCSALFLAALDMTIITTAIPTIATEFTSNLGYVWIGSSYLLANAAFVPTWGKFSDIWGRKPVLLASVSIFWVGSLVCGLSHDMPMLIAGRAVQGLGGGGVIVLVNICIGDLFSPRNRGMYYGMLGIVWAVASAVGPVVGGVLTTEVTWRWCFYINLPICGVASIVLFFVLKLHNPRTPVWEGLAAVDWMGSILIIGGTLMFLFGLEFGGVNYPWDSPMVICLIVFGILTITGFGIYEAKFAHHPLIPLRIFHDRSNCAAFAVCFFHAFVYMGGNYWLPLYFQGVLSVSALMSGVWLLPYVLGMSTVSTATGMIIKKTGNYKIGIVCGLVLTTIGFGLFVDFEPRENLTKLVIYQLIAGIGIGPNFQSPLIALQSTLEPRDIAGATSTFGFIRQMSTSISVVIGGVVFSHEMKMQEPALQKELSPETAALLTGENAAANVDIVAVLEGREGDIARGAFFTSLRMMFVVYVCFAAAGLVAGVFVRQKQLSKVHQEHKTGLKTLRSREGKDAKQ